MATQWFQGGVQVYDDGTNQFFVAGVEVNNNQSAGTTVTPSTLALTLATFAPAVLTPRVVTPSTLALTLTTFAPAVLTPRVVTPSTKALTLATFAPTVRTPRVVTPDTLALTTTGYTPTVATTSNVVVTPSTLALRLTTYAPTVIGTEVVVPPTIGGGGVGWGGMWTKEPGHSETEEIRLDVLLGLLVEMDDPVLGGEIQAFELLAEPVFGRVARLRVDVDPPGPPSQDEQMLVLYRRLDALERAGKRPLDKLKRIPRALLALIDEDLAGMV